MYVQQRAEIRKQAKRRTSELQINPCAARATQTRKHEESHKVIYRSVYTESAESSCEVKQSLVVGGGGGEFASMSLLVAHLLWELYRKGFFGLFVNVVGLR